MNVREYPLTQYKSSHTAKAEDTHSEISVGHCGYWSQITQREQTTPTARSQWGIVGTPVRSHSESWRRPLRDLGGALWVHESDHTARADDITVRSQWVLKSDHTARADDAHCEISVGHCGYFCRAASTWLGCTSSDMRRYSFCTRVPPELSSGRTSSSDIRCSNAWNKSLNIVITCIYWYNLINMVFVWCCTLFNYRDIPAVWQWHTLIYWKPIFSCYQCFRGILEYSICPLSV